MRPSLFGGILIALLGLSGCDRTHGPGGQHGGRYLDIGVYQVGQMWSHLAMTANPPSAAATIADDEQVIVVVDSQTGEIRQCGNLSGHCITMNPWSGSAAPVNLDAHAADLQRVAADAANSPENAEAVAGAVQNTADAVTNTASRRRPDQR